MHKMHGVWKPHLVIIEHHHILRIMHFAHNAYLMKLSVFLTKNNLSASAFARMIQVDPATVLRIRAGKVFPHRKTMEAIWTATDGQVGPNDFLEENLTKSDANQDQPNG
jgi:hypothetical protein